MSLVWLTDVAEAISSAHYPNDYLGCSALSSKLTRRLRGAALSGELNCYDGTGKYKPGAHENLISTTKEAVNEYLGIPFDVSKPDELKTMLATCGAEIINALDNGRIHFDKMEDKAAFYGLLTVTTDYVMDGKIRTAFTKATMN